MEDAMKPERIPITEKLARRIALRWAVVERPKSRRERLQEALEEMRRIRRLLIRETMACGLDSAVAEA